MSDHRGGAVRVYETEPIAADGRTVAREAKTVNVSEVSPREAGRTISAELSYSLVEARRASRELTKKMPQSERAALYEEHRAITAKMFESTISDAESRRLRYVRWRLDRIEDADIGNAMDELQMLAEAQERLASQVQDFVEASKSISHRGKRKR